MRVPLSLILLTLLVMPASSSRAQTGVAHFSKDGLSFDYPEGWTLEDKSKDEIRHLVIKRPDGSVILMVVAQRDPLQDYTQLHASRDAITRPYVANIARMLNAEVSSDSGMQCMPVGESLAVGRRMAGRLGQEPSTGEVYAVAKEHLLIHLFYVRQDKDEASGAAAWKTLTDTLKVEPASNASRVAAGGAQVFSGGVLDTKVLKKPAPSYPAEAMQAGAQGTVLVQIVVDEKGDVVSARAASGHPTLRRAGEDAARRAKFAPTMLCDKPVRLAGVITYNFVVATR